MAITKEFATYEDLVKALKALTVDEILPSVLLTPPLAEAILAHDPVNRDLRKANVEKLKREITGGHWDHRKSSLMRFLESDGRLTAPCWRMAKRSAMSSRHLGRPLRNLKLRNFRSWRTYVLQTERPR